MIEIGNLLLLSWFRTTKNQAKGSILHIECFYIHLRKEDIPVKELNESTDKTKHRTSVDTWQTKREPKEDPAEETCDNCEAVIRERPKGEGKGER